MVDTQVRVEGLRDLRRRLKAIDTRAPRELNKASKRVAMAVARQAADYAPRDSGTLAASIRVGSRGDRITLRSPLPYAAPIHWGWPARNIRGSFFLTRAADEKRDEFIDELRDEIRDLARQYGLGPESFSIF